MANSNSALVTKLLLIVVGMFGFGFAFSSAFSVIHHRFVAGALPPHPRS